MLKKPITAAGSQYANCLYFSSGALARKTEQLATRAWRPSGLTPSLAYLLLLVLDRPQAYPTLLVRHTLLSPSTITRLLKKLEAKGLVKRNYYHKLTIVYATKEAFDLQPTLWKCQEAFLRLCRQTISRQEGDQLAATMNQTTDKLMISINKRKKHLS